MGKREKWQGWVGNEHPEGSEGGEREHFSLEEAQNLIILHSAKIPGTSQTC